MSRQGTIAIQNIVVGLPCRKGNRVREQLQNEPDIAVGNAI
jgi:hypothetical protein